MKNRIISIPPSYFFFCIIVSLSMFFVVPKMNLIYFPYNLILGAPLLLMGLYCISSPHFTLKRKNTPENYQKSTCVVKEDLYRYSRNPMYLGFVIFLIGFSLFVGNILSLVCPIFFFIIMNWMFIPYEEEKMRNELGSKYLKYEKTVRRWL